MQRQASLSLVGLFQVRMLILGDKQYDENFLYFPVFILGVFFKAAPLDVVQLHSPLKRKDVI